MQQAHERPKMLDVRGRITFYGRALCRVSSVYTFGIPTRESNVPGNVYNELLVLQHEFYESLEHSLYRVFTVFFLSPGVAIPRKHACASQSCPIALLGLYWRELFHMHVES